MKEVSFVWEAASLPIRPRLVPMILLACGIAAPGARAQEGDVEAAIAEIQKAGGKVDRDDKGPGKPVVGVNFATTQATDAALEPLKGLAQLKKITLNGTKVTDAGLAHLEGLKELQKIYLVDTKITDAGLEHLKGLTNLQIVSLVGTEVTDAGLEHLAGLTNLQEVFLAATKATDEGVKKLKEANPKLKVDR